MKKIKFKILIILIASQFFFGLLFSQYKEDQRIDSVINLISQQKITKYIRELSGDTTVIIGGMPRLIFSRYYSSPGNVWAAQYIYEKFQSFGLNPIYWTVDSLCKNVIAVKPGTRYPNQKFIIGAHYDNILWNISGPQDTVYGADDNASGVSGVLEAARLLANMSFPYTIIFAAWDQEENNNVWGSRAYADSAYLYGDSIKAYINMDMIGWNYFNQNKFWTGPDTNSMFFNEIFNLLKIKYSPQLTSIYNFTSGSDNLAFLLKNYRTFEVCEQNVYSNPNWHMITDRIANIDLSYCTSIIKPTVALLMVLALNKNAFYEHKPISSTYDTTPRIIKSIIKFPNKLPVANGSPRLYYKANNEPFAFVNSFYNNLDTFKFIIPGKPRGSLVKYYFAAQDSVENFICTYPVGGSGINPPGTIPPQNFFSYEIFTDYSQCSNTLPKPINDLQYTNDTIQIFQNKFVEKINVNLTIFHQDDGDLYVQLKGPCGTINLSKLNGTGGSNYINTTFDDDALIPITQGIPPFTGNYQPQAPLSFFKNQSANDIWVLRIFDSKAGNTGTFISWCVLMRLKSKVSIKENNVPVKFELSQNYPNPFNNSTRINYSIPINSYVELKIYDLLGRELKTLVNSYQNAGEYSLTFSATDLSSGIFFYRLTTGDYSEMKKMILVK